MLGRVANLGWRGIVGVALIVAASGAIVIGLRPTVIDVAIASSQVDSAVKAARDAGIPWTSDELVALGQVRGTENALGHLQAAADMIHSDRESSPNAFLSYNITLRFLKEEVGRKDDALAELRLAVSKTKVDYRRDWDLGVGQAFPEYAEARDCTKLLCSSALMCAMSGRAAEAAQDLAAARHVALLTAQDPTIRAVNIALICDAIALSTATRCMAYSAGSASELEAYRDLALDRPFRCDLAASFSGEAYLGVATIRNLEALGGWRIANRSVRARRIENPVRTGIPGSLPDRAFLVRHLRFWTAAVQAARPFPDDAVEAAEAAMRATSGSFRHSGFSMSLLAPRKDDLRLLRDLLLRSEAAWIVNRVLADVLIHRAKKGRFPAKLEELGQVPQDPMTGLPLQYKVDGGTVRVWSVGADGRDEGGLTRQEKVMSGRKSFGYDDALASYPPPEENSSVF